MGPFLVNIAPSMFRVASPFLISSTPTGGQASPLHQSLRGTSTFAAMFFGMRLLLHFVSSTGKYVPPIVTYLRS